MKKILLFGFIFASFLMITSCNNHNSSSSEEVTYTVTWKIGENSYNEEYVKGETPVYKFGTTKKSDCIYEYTFKGWDKEITPVNNDITYVAEYEQSYIDYIYTWVINGVEEKETYHYGETPYYKGDNLNDYSDGLISYSFAKWDKKLTPVVGNETIVAIFDSTYNQYEISFDVNGKITKESYYYGAVPSLEYIPTKDSNDQYFYEFSSWLDTETNIEYKTLPEVTKNANYKAQFNEITKWNGVKLKLLNLDGSLIEEKVVEYELGEYYTIYVPEIDGLTPSYQYVSGLVSENLSLNIYYSEVDVWDHEKISSSLFGDGTKQSPYLIQNAADLAYFRKEVNSGNEFTGVYFKLTKSIDVNDYNFMFNKFSGHFNGNNCSILGLNIINSAEKTGLFKDLGKGGSISYLNTYGNISGMKYTAAIAGVCRGAIYNCTNYASIESYGANIAGVVGYSTKDSDFISNCTNYGSINGTKYHTAGVVGYATGSISNCVNHGDIYSTGDCVGGVVGASTKSLINCINYADITAKASIGGIVFNSTAILSNCINYGNIYGKYNNGGIASLSKADCFNCINYGEVNGATELGGIASKNEGKIYNCINNGNVISTSWGAGGIVGAGINNVEGCINNGTISGKGQIGGIVGKNSTLIIDCVNNGTIIASYENAGESHGGIAGINYYVVKDCINFGSVIGSSTGKAGGISGKQGNDSDSFVPIISNCINYGTVNIISEDGVQGGIVGYLIEGEISECANYGLISGSKANGGIVGKAYSSGEQILINKCINYGEVNGTVYFAGGIFGTIDNTLVANCINNGNIINTADCIGGLGGAVYANGIVSNSINNGLLIATTKVGGLIYNNKGTIEDCSNYGSILLTIDSGTSEALVFKNEGVINNCVSGTNETHLHDYSIFRYDNNYHWYECECGARKVDSLSKHTYSLFLANNDATCTSNETQSAYCDKNCGHKLTKDVANTMLNHQYSILNNDGDCHWYECECGTINQSTKVDHYGGVSDCTHQAFCEFCDLMYKDYSHNFSELIVAKEATCDEDGNIDYYYCLDCRKHFNSLKEEIVSAITQALGHSYDEGVLNESIRTYTCSVCDDISEVNVYKVKWNINGNENEIYADENTNPVYSKLTPYKVDSNSVYSYKFLGWSTSENGEVIDLTKEIVNENKVYYAIFEEKLIIKELKVLMIGNSFSDDTVQWVHEIADSLGINIVIANLYIGGCILSTHLSNLSNDSNAYQYVTYDKTTRTWNRIPNTSISSALGYEDWDYVSLQQGSSQSGLVDTYNDINAIMDKILTIKNDVKFVWNMTWAYQQDSGHGNFGSYNNDQMTMYNMIINSVKDKVVLNNRFVSIIPIGTVVQNARTSFIGDNLCRDTACHLTYTFGRYMAGLTLVSQITGIDISNITYVPSNVSDEYKAIAIESVINAIRNPFEITQSSYVD